MSTLYSFACGHVGRTADLSTGFIRVAEIRKAPVVFTNTPCPDCNK